METEISVAVDFLLTFLHSLPQEKLEELAHKLTEILQQRYTGHWYPDRPSKGNGYRCLNVNQSVLDPTLTSAVRQCALSTNSVSRSLPENLSLWVDPHEVSYRMGDRGPVDVLYAYQDDRHCAAATYDVSTSWGRDNYASHPYVEFPDHPAQFQDYGQYDLSSGCSSDVEMDNSEGDFFTYRGEVFSKRALSDYLDTTSAASFTSSSGYTTSSGYTPTYTTSYHSYGSPQFVRKMQTLVH